MAQGDGQAVLKKMGPLLFIEKSETLKANNGADLEISAFVRRRGAKVWGPLTQLGALNQLYFPE